MAVLLPLLFAVGSFSNGGGQPCFYSGHEKKFAGCVHFSILHLKTKSRRTIYDSAQTTGLCGSMSSLEYTTESIKNRFVELTGSIEQRPYDVRTWRARGEFLRSRDYHDLAVGDFYKALLLTDDALDLSGEYHDQALTALGFDPDVLNEDDSDEVPEAVSRSFKEHALHCYAELVDCLNKLGARKSAKHFYAIGTNLDDGNDKDIAELKAKLLEPKANCLAEEDQASLNDATNVRRELYPWNNHEPDRYSAESIDYLNQKLQEVAPKCIVKAVDLPILYADQPASESSSTTGATSTIKQLGLFAKEDITPGETVLQEKSLLAVNNRLHDELCDACSIELPSNTNDSHACDECMTAIYCSQDCLDQAMESYHPAVCGNEDFEAINKDVEAKDASNALYSLLLGRAIAMSETQELHPLDLPEVTYLWGDYSAWEEPRPASEDKNASARPRTLPWSFEYNIAGPIHMLTMLDVDVFATTERYDLWILNTLFSKFRGVANARMNPRTGKPEVAASHYRWCLANHSCAPNVTWEWGGEIKMRARDGNKDEVVRWGPGRDLKDSCWNGGLKAGEEVLNHYCDVDLPVDKRREWAAGALGGMCMCGRCVWEAKHSS